MQWPNNRGDRIPPSHIMHQMKIPVLEMGYI